MITKEQLSQQLASLLERREQMEQQERPYLMALYYSKLGALECRIFNLQLECRTLQQQIELAMQKLNHGEALTQQCLDEIERQVKVALTDWQTQLVSQLQTLNNSQEYLAGLVPVNPAEAQRAKLAYRRLARLLHPDINPDQQSLFEQYWPTIQNAYREYDADMLEALLHTVDQALSATPSAETDEALIARLSELVKRHTEKLVELSHAMPFCFAELLKDDAWVAAQQAALEDEFEVVSQQWAHLTARYADIKARAIPEA